MGLAKDR